MIPVVQKDGRKNVCEREELLDKEGYYGDNLPSGILLNEFK